jgi:hypothetical protein
MVIGGLDELETRERVRAQRSSDGTLEFATCS